MKQQSATQKIITAAGPRNSGSAQTSAPMNQKVFAAAREAGVKMPASPKPAPSGRK
jgi:formylmethanofuran:tetrahydromethanopterin formyltransferase